MKDKKVVLVQFKNESKLHLKDYAFFTDLNLIEGDLAVAHCDGPSSHADLDICKVVQVEGILPHQSKKATRWILCKIDLAEHKRRLLDEKNLQEKLNQLRERKNKFQEMAMYNMMAKEDPETARLLKEVGELDPSLKLLVSAEPLKVK